MPKPQEKNNSPPKANVSNAGVAQANTRSGAAVAAIQRNPATNTDSGDIIKAIDGLKNDIKGHNDCLKKEIIQLRQEVNGKLDNLATAVQSLSDRVDEAETRVEQVEGWTEEATETLCMYIKQQRALQQKLTDLESRSRRNNIHIFGVAEGEEGNSATQYVEKFIKSELPLPEDMDLKIQRANRSLAPRSRPDAPPRPIIVNFLEFTTKELILRSVEKEENTSG